MVGSSFGTLFRITTFGESHGAGLGVIVDGCPSGIPLSLENIATELGRRRPGQSKLVSPRKEADEFEVLSGLFEGQTTGSPLMFLVRNEDVKSKDYDALREVFRPGHADFSYFAKYGIRDHRGGGRSSARETIGRVIGGAIAKQLLSYGRMTIRGGVIQVGSVKAVRRVWEQVEENDLRSVDPDTIEAMRKEIESARHDRDSVGGAVEVQAVGVPPGLGEPVFGKLDGVIAGAMMSIPAVKGVEIGAGCDVAGRRGSELNDEMTPEGFRSNHHGGILGGISTGAPIVCRLAIKPTSSLPRDQETVNVHFETTSVRTLGRHDPCVALRAVPIAEAMMALVLVDYWLQDLGPRALKEIAGLASPVVRYGVLREK